MISNTSLECYLHDKARVTDVIAVGAVVVMKIYFVLKLVKMNVRINLRFIKVIQFREESELNLRQCFIHPFHSQLFLGIAKRFKFHLAYLLIPGKLMEVHGTGNIKVHPVAVSYCAVII